MNRVLLSAGLLLMVAPGRAFGEERTFSAPMIDGKRLDLCRDWGSGCGQAAANAWCKLQSFDAAKAWTPANDIGAQTPTIVLNGRRVCDQPGCDGFDTITCTRGASPAAPPPAKPDEQGLVPPTTESGANAWTTQDVIDPRIDEQAQYALMRMFVGDDGERADASNILTAVKTGALGGIYQQDQGVPAKRAVKLGIGWWQLLPPASEKPRIDGVCVKAPEGDPPLIVMRKGAQSNKAAYDWALRDAWSSCGLQSTSPVRPYKVTLPAKQPKAKDTQCGNPTGEEGIQRVNVQVVTANGQGIEGAIVDLAIGDLRSTKTADEEGRAHFIVPRPGTVTVAAREPEGVLNAPWKAPGTILLPSVKTVQVLPGCSHRVRLELPILSPR